MAEQEQETNVPAEVPEGEEDNPNYKPPAPKALDDIIKQDADDESLVKYKETLLGANANIVLDESNPNKVIINKLSLLAEGRDEVSIDLTRPLDEIKKQTFTIKEGVKYKIKIYFHVQRDIVCGLRYEQKVQKSHIPKSEKMKQMMGSYGPKADLQSYTTPEDTAPSGMLLRGDYKVVSKFIDDDGFEYANWEWHLSVKKDWS